MIDNAGLSLPYLFIITSGFEVVWVIVLGFIYTVFCKKYEENLIKKKEEEMENTQNSSKKTSNAKLIKEFENPMQYWRSQIAGMTKF